MIDEFQFIKYIKEYFESELIGDDAAAINFNNETTLISKDILIENIHFKIQNNLFQIGAKSLISNISDIIAMGGLPSHFFLGLGITEELFENDIYDLIKGIKFIAKKYNLTLSGGDISKSNNDLFISVTITGKVSDGYFVTRNSAETGDDIWVTGELGDSFIGLQIILGKLAVKDTKLKNYFVQRHYLRDLYPEFINNLVKKKLINAMIDISDGFQQDLSHILHESGKSAEIDLKAVPYSENFGKIKYILKKNFYKIPFISGEEYELIFTSDSANRNKILKSAEKFNVKVSNVGKIMNKCAKDINFLNSDNIKFENFKNVGYKHFNKV